LPSFTTERIDATARMKSTTPTTETANATTIATIFTYDSSSRAMRSSA